MGFFATLAFLATWWMAFAPQQTTQDYLQHLAGQRLILRHYADSENSKAKESDLIGKKGGCDAAVEVMNVALSNASVRLTFRNVGSPIIRKKNMGCARQHDLYSFTISDFPFDQSPEQAADIIGHVLQTPEAYLAASGITWNPSPVPDSESPVQFPGPGLTAPVAVLSITPNFSKASAKAPMGGIVEFHCVIGTDGLVHDPVITKGFTDTENKRALDALKFWRLEPARDGTRLVAVKMTIGFSFRPF